MNLDQQENMNKIEYQKIGNLPYNRTSQPSIFRAKNWVEINDDRR